MIYALITFLVLLALFCAWQTHRFLLWVFFLAVMRLEETRDAGDLTPRGKRWGEVAEAMGLALDISYNWSWACIEFCGIPREALVTYRLKRYKYGTPGFQPPVLPISGGVFARLWLRFRTWFDVPQPPATGWRLAKTNAYASDLLDPNDPSKKHV